MAVPGPKNPKGGPQPLLSKRRVNSRPLIARSGFLPFSTIKRAQSGSAATIPAQSITGSGIASSEAFGSGQVNQSVIGSGVASSEALGSGVIKQTLVGSGIVSQEALGSGSVVLRVVGSGVPSAQAFGAGVVRQIVGGSGVPSSEALGSGLVRLVVGGAGVPSSESFGSGSLLNLGPQSINGSGMPSSEAFGSGIFLGGVQVAEVLSGPPLRKRRQEIEARNRRKIAAILALIDD